MGAEKLRQEEAVETVVGALIGEQAIPRQRIISRRPETGVFWNDDG